jgi:hypothetical protein
MVIIAPKTPFRKDVTLSGNTERQPGREVVGEGGASIRRSRVKGSFGKGEPPSTPFTAAVLKRFLKYDKIEIFTKKEAHR